MITKDSAFAELRTVKGRSAFIEDLAVLIESSGMVSTGCTIRTDGKDTHLDAELTNSAGHGLRFSTSINPDREPLGHWGAVQPSPHALPITHAALAKFPGADLSGAFQVANHDYSGRTHHKATLMPATPAQMLHIVKGCLELHMRGEAVKLAGPMPAIIPVSLTVSGLAGSIGNLSAKNRPATWGIPSWNLAAQLLLDAGLDGHQALAVMRSVWPERAVQAATIWGDPSPLQAFSRGLAVILADQNPVDMGRLAA